MSKHRHNLLSIDRVYLAMIIYRVCRQKLGAVDSATDLWSDKCYKFSIHKGSAFLGKGCGNLFVLEFHTYSHPSHLIAYVFNLFEPESVLVPQVSVPPFTSLLSCIEKCYDRCLVCSLERGICACHKLDVMNPNYYRYTRCINELMNISHRTDSHIDMHLLNSSVTPAFRTPFVTTMPEMIRPPLSKLTRILFLAIEALHSQSWFHCKHSDIIMCVIRDGNDLVCFLTNYHNNPHIYVYYHCWDGNSTEDFTFPTYPLSYCYPLHHPLSVCVTKLRNPLFFASRFCTDLFMRTPKWFRPFCRSLALPDPFTCKSCCDEHSYSCGGDTAASSSSSSSGLVTRDWQINCPNL